MIGIHQLINKDSMQILIERPKVFLHHEKEPFFKYQVCRKRINGAIMENHNFQVKKLNIK